MKPGQIAQLQELERCWLTRSDRAWLKYLSLPQWGVEFIKDGKKQLRRLTHQYRGQIAAMRKNRARL